ncbi:MAG: hypothetical protein ABSE62_16805, partial [Chthoniobacteraceae bacterium]
MDETRRTHSCLSLIVAWVAALVLGAGVLHVKWLNFPLSRQLRGMEFGLGAYVPGAQHARVFSFGCVAAGLILAGILFYTMRWWRALGWTGAALIWIAALAPLKATLLDANLLETLAVESSQQQLAATFTQQALPVNFGPEPTVNSRLEMDTVEDRLMAAWYFVHAGWWAALFAGV